ncbi:YqjK-like family protein [Proteus sp. NMG38-2]|uniref:YqjK-like family protein n=1 Tax=Proteus sp. NMG38-2 TaxID=2883107 RepID=UPI001D0A25F2|nr:YqjK-like family protein [Proteus sp. NMG38-2]UDN36648.1 YqjK-like family protein [Proteus sp. NMG38-2]
MMNKQNKQSVLSRRKKLLLNKIQQQRSDLGQSTQTWLDVTEHYDKAWRILVSLKPAFLVGASFISLYSIKHPKKIIRLGQRAIGAFGLIRAIQKSFKKTSD